MTEIVSVCTVEISGKQYTLVPDNPAFGRQNVPKQEREGLRNGMRVIAARRNNRITIESVLPPMPEKPSPAPAPQPARSAQRAAQADRRAPAPRSQPGGRAGHGDSNPGRGQGQGRNMPNGARQNGSQGGGQPDAGQGQQQPQPATGYFANPYNFVPFSTAMRTTLPGLAMGAPQGHDRWHEGRYCAKLRIQFTVKTPLLSVELTGKEEGEPAVYSVRRDGHGAPIVSGASIKGMLRATYEQATGSRLGVFKHDEPESIRASSTDAVKLKMARVDQHEPEAERLKLTVIDQLRPLDVRLPPRDQPLSAISVPMWLIPTKLGHGKSVYAWVHLLKHNELVHLKGGGTKRIIYHYWRAVSVAGEPTVSPPGVELGQWDTRVASQGPVLVQGLLHATGKSFPRKGDERLFVERVIEGRARPEYTPLTVEHREYNRVMASWRRKLDSFQQEPFTSVVDGVQVSVGPASYVNGKRAWKELLPRQTLYVRLKQRMHHLYPALITRESFPHAPAELLGADLAPADRRSRMTAAERVFGWVAGDDGSPGATHRALLRVGGVSVSGGGAVATAGSVTWELATLNSPKPANARFYTRDGDGRPLHGQPKADGYQLGQLLAGHKVYPHHQREAEYWTFPAGGWGLPNRPGKTPHPRVAGHYQNFLAAPETKPDVSVVIRDWIEPGATIKTTLYAEDLHHDELAALLWVITLGDGEDARHHRLGMGKPLGFGSLAAKIIWAESELWDRDAINSRYDASTPAPMAEYNASEAAAIGDKLIKGFDETFRHASPATFQSILAAARGTALPVHYPRMGRNAREVEPQSKTYQWFVATDGPRAPKHALPLLTEAAGTPPEDLPTNPLADRRASAE